MQTPSHCALDGGFGDPSTRQRSIPDALHSSQDMITPGGDKPIKILNYISKNVTETLEGHTSNVSFTIYQPMLPIIAIAPRMAQSRKWTGFGLVLWSLKRGWDEPAYSMADLLTPAIVKYSQPLFKLPRRARHPEGARIPPPRHELASTEIYANSIVLFRNGWPVNVVEIYTALAWRKSAFGPGNRASDSNTHAGEGDKLNLMGKKDDVIKAGN